MKNINGTLPDDPPFQFYYDSDLLKIGGGNTVNFFNGFFQFVLHAF